MTHYDPALDDDEDSQSPITRLTDEESWDLVRRKEFGRLAYHLAGEVHLVPINYATDGERLFFRTAEGSKLLGIVMNEDCAFEIDDITDESATSVVMRGKARLLEGGEESVVESLPLHPWVATLKFNVVAITPNEGEISGRTFQLTRR